MPKLTSSFFPFGFSETLSLVLLKTNTEAIKKQQTNREQHLNRWTTPKGNASTMYLKATQVSKIKYLSGN